MWQDVKREDIHRFGCDDRLHGFSGSIWTATSRCESLHSFCLSSRYCWYQWCRWGRGKIRWASGRMGFMLTTFTMNSFQPNEPFHLTILFPDHLLYHIHLIYFRFVSSRTFSFYLIHLSVLLLSHSPMISPFTLSRRFHPTLFIISCGGVSMILGSIISLVSRSFCRTYPQHAFSIYLIIFLSHHLIHCFTSSVFSLAYLIRCFASIIVLPHALYMYDCMIWKCLHLSFCSRCCKRICIHTEFVRYTDILIQTRAYVYIYIYIYIESRT